MTELLIILSLLVTASYDFFYRRISNKKIILIFFLSFLLFLIDKDINFGFSMVSGVFGFVFALVFYIMKLMGAADVKLAAVLGFLGGGWVLSVSWLISVPVVLAAGVYYKSMQVNGCRGDQYKVSVSRRIVPFGGIWIICFLIVWVYVKAKAYGI